MPSASRQLSHFPIWWFSMPEWVALQVRDRREQPCDLILAENHRQGLRHTHGWTLPNNSPRLSVISKKNLRAVK
jgi:hypothetical protein